MRVWDRAQRDKQALQRRMEVLDLPVVPLRRHGWIGAPDDQVRGRLGASTPAAVGVGPDGDLLAHWPATNALGDRHGAVTRTMTGARQDTLTASVSDVPGQVNFVQPLPDGAILLSSGRSLDQDADTAGIWNDEGHRVASGSLGDAIEHVLTTPSVQGPPGTGKTHTIVNLVSHLVAYGKRVLVTAQNEQALAVLQEKIPASLRDLSVAVLGSGPEAMDQLRASAQAMTDLVSGLDVERETVRVGELGDQVEQLRVGLRQAELAMVEALRREESEFDLPSGPAKAGEVAAWLAAGEGELG